MLVVLRGTVFSFVLTLRDSKRYIHMHKTHAHKVAIERPRRGTARVDLELPRCEFMPSSYPTSSGGTLLGLYGELVESSSCS